VNSPPAPAETATNDDLLKRRRQRWIRRGEITAAVTLAIALLWLIFDWNWFKAPVERRVTAATGREFHILGNLDVDLSMKPLIRMDGLTLGNAPASAEPTMATAKRLAFRIDLWKLVNGDVILPEVVLTDPRLLLEVDKTGKGNWIFRDDGTPTRWPLIRQLLVDDGQLHYRNSKRRTDVRVDVRSGEPSKDSRRAPLLISGGGKYGGNIFKIAGSIQSPLVLEDSTKPYHIDLKATAGATTATAKGSLQGAFQMTGFDLDFSLAGADMSQLYPLLGIAVPPTPPYRLRGRLGHVARTWTFNRFTGRVGDSDLAGDSSFDTGGVRPFLRARMVSKRLDLDDLGGFVGLAPQTGGGETATPVQAQQSLAQKSDGRVLPSRPFELERLRSMDADVTLKAQHINSPPLPLDAMDAHIFIDNGLLRLDPLAFDAAGGRIEGKIVLDARKDLIATSADVTVRGLELPKLFPDAKLTQDSTGRISGRIDLDGHGNSVASMLASSDGQVALVMGRGRISNLLLEYAGLDIAESLKFLIGKDQVVPIRCAYADFGVKNGLMTSRQLAFDTTDTAILGEGTINLDDETLDLVLKPRPKDRSWLSLRSPLVVGGTFQDPSFRPDAKALTLRGGIALALGSLAPPAALLALFERGPGDDLDCGGTASGTTPAKAEPTGKKPAGLKPAKSLSVSDRDAAKV
jgi:AsmA family protein